METARRTWGNTEEKPYDQYDHNGFEDNADAHLKRSVMGREVIVAVTDGKLDFGTWEQIFSANSTVCAISGCL